MTVGSRERADMAPSVVADGRDDGRAGSHGPRDERPPHGSRLQRDAHAALALAPDGTEPIPIAMFGGPKTLRLLLTTA